MPSNSPQSTAPPMMSSATRHRRAALHRWEIIARALGMIGSLATVAAVIAVLQSDSSLEAGGPPPIGVPSKYYLALELLAAATVGIIGVVRGSRPLIGAAGGLILPLGLMSLMVLPAALLIAACGVIPARRKTRGRELASGVLIVLLCLTPFFVPAVMSSPRCWAEIQDARGIRYELTQGMTEGLPGQISTTCAERVPEPMSFPIALTFVMVAVGLALASSQRQRTEQRGAVVAPG
jgi:hypothetical protein